MDKASNWHAASGAAARFCLQLNDIDATYARRRLCVDGRRLRPTALQPLDGPNQVRVDHTAASEAQQTQCRIVGFVIADARHGAKVLRPSHREPLPGRGAVVCLLWASSHLPSSWRAGRCTALRTCRAMASSAIQYSSFGTSRDATCHARLASFTYLWHDF